jgi:dTDP-4-dehydrorhamnose 3,5-epimerase
MGTDIVPMAAVSTGIDGLLRITTKAVTDDRGTVREYFRTSSFAEAGIDGGWAQVNLTWTRQGALRGLHGEASDKLVGVAHGEAFGVYLDARPGSASRGTVVTERLVPGVQMFVPAGVCNGFQAVSDGGCQYLYCFASEWQPGMAGVAVCPMDPDLAIGWTIAARADDPAMVSAKDAAAPRFAELSGGERLARTCGCW